MGRARRTAAAAAAGLALSAVAGRRARHARRAHALACRLDTPNVDQRIEVARTLVDEGLTVSASDLLLFVRTEHEPAVLHAVARAVREAPPVTRPSANVRELLLWSDIQLGALPTDS